MRWFFSLIFILLLQSYPVFAKEQSAVEVRLSSAPQKTVRAKSLFTSVFVIANPGTKEDLYAIEARVPQGWQVISSLEDLRLLPGETKILPLTVFVPTNALADGKYQIFLSAISRTDPDIKAEAVVVVGVLPHAKIEIISPAVEEKASPGESISYTFIIVNLGNGKENVQINATSAHGEKVGISNEIIELGVGEQKDVKTTIHVPLDVSPGTRHCLTFRASSALLEKGQFSEVIVYTLITEKRAKPEGVYKTLSSQLTTHLSGLATGRPLGPQVEFNTHGFVTDTYWLNFNYQGPYFKDRENYRGLSQERTTLDFGEKFWDMTLGDTTINLSELTAASVYEPGAKLRIQKNPISAMVFELERRLVGFRERISGGRIASKIGRDNELGINFFQSDEDKTDQSVSRLAEEKKIASITGISRLKNLFIQGEFAGSSFDNGSGQKHDTAWWIDSKLRKEKLYADAEYISAGPNYPGRRKDTEGHRAYLSYRIFKPQWAWIYNHKIVNNPKRYLNKNTDTTDRVEVGTSFNLKRFPFFSISYQTTDTKSERAALLSDTKERAIVLRSNRSFEHITVSFDSNWGTKKDNITSISSRTAEYTTRLYGHWKKLNPWVGYTYNIERDILQDSKTTTVREELGMLYQPLNNFYTTFSFSREGERGQSPKDILSFDITYDPIEDTSFTLEGEMRDDHSEFDREWRLWLTFRRSFDMPVPLKIRGTVKGILFIDGNDNGVLDEGEKGLPKIAMVLERESSITNNDGRFRFPAVVAGECRLNIDISTLPVDLASRQELPYKINLPRGKTVNVNIPLVKVCKIRGIVFDDANKNGIRDEGEKGVPLMRILIVDSSLKTRETFSDNNGFYTFAGILPGQCEVKIDEAWLPTRYVVATSVIYSVDLAQGQEVSTGLDFGISEKERPVIKTYSTQGEGVAPQQ